MTREELLEAISDNGKITPIKCRESYLKAHGLWIHLENLVPADFITAKEKIRHLRTGEGYCSVCGAKCEFVKDSFRSLCSKHFKKGRGGAKKGSGAHNRIDIPKELLEYLYYNKKLSVNSIPAHLPKEFGKVSNVTIHKRMEEYGLIQREFSETQSLTSGTKGRRAHNRILLDVEKVISDYQNKKPVKAIANEYCCADDVIYRCLRSNGIELKNRRTYIEWKIIDFLENNNIAYLTNKKLLDGLEIDIFLPKYNIGIEAHGLEFHTEGAGKKDNRYHRNKFDIACKKGIYLYQLWGHEICDDRFFSIITNNILEKTVGLSRISPDELTLGNVCQKDIKSFFDRNHVLGHYSGDQTCLVLRKGESLVSAVSFSGSGSDTIINRLANEKGVSLDSLEIFLDKIPGSRIIAKTNNDLGPEDCYLRASFVLTSETDYDTWYTDRSTVSASPDSKSLNQSKLDCFHTSGTRTWILDRGFFS